MLKGDMDTAENQNKDKNEGEHICIALVWGSIGKGTEIETARKEKQQFCIYIERKNIPGQGVKENAR